MSDTIFLTFWHLLEETDWAPNPQKVFIIISPLAARSVD